MAKVRAISSPKDAEKRWRTESDMRTLIDAEAIKNDSKRMANVQAMAKEKMLEVAKIAADTKD